MEQIRYEMIVRARDAIAQGMTTIGNQQLMMRRGVRLPGGDHVDVPSITGDAIRHQLRVAATHGTLHLSGLLSDPQLSEGAARLLFNGGALTGKGNAGVINLDRYRELVALVPPLALFGGNTDSRPMEGQLYVDEGSLLCKEMEHLMPPWVLEWCGATGERLTSFRDCTEEVTRVRTDCLTSPNVIKLLAPDAQTRVSNRLLAAEKAHETGDAKLARESKSEMMPRTHERIKQGELLWIGVEARVYSDLELDAFNFTIACLLSNFRVGGHSATGHGRLEFVKGMRCNFLPASGNFEPVGAELAPKVGDLYRRHLELRREELAAWIRSAINS